MILHLLLVNYFEINPRNILKKKASKIFNQTPEYLNLDYRVKKQKTVTVPLAGYMSLFFLISYVCHWAGVVNAVYTI